MGAASELHKLIEKLNLNETIDIGFLTPAAAAVIACACHRATKPKVHYVNELVRKYSDYAQLSYVLNGCYANPKQASYQKTCSRLCQIKDQTDIDVATSSIRALLRTHLDHKFRVIQDIIKVVGELHDNIFSHAEGLGYSMAQIYKGNTPRVEFAVVDAGIGLKRSVRAVKAVKTDQEAVALCIGKGFSTKKLSSSWAQKIDRDVPNPFSDNVPTRRSSDNHQGLGLYLLTELIEKLEGRLWICTGHASLVQNAGKRYYTANRYVWRGTAIAVSVSLSPKRVVATVQSSDKLREALGL